MELFNYQTVALLACWTFILCQGARQRTYRSYVLLHLLTAISLLTFCYGLVILTLLGSTDPAYVEAYLLEMFTGRVLMIALFVWLASLPRKLTSAHFVLFAVICVAGVSLELVASPENNPAWRAIRAIQFMACGFGTFALWSCFATDRFRMGRNLGIPLIALSFRTLLEAINASAYLTRSWSYESFNSLQGFLDVAMWGVIALAQFELDPPQRRH